MDDEHTAGFREPCTQCSAVDWGISDEGRFYCRTCHNVIERTKDVVDLTFTPGSARVSTLGRRTRQMWQEGGRKWAVCEGFQFILRNQANALIRLGVSPSFKDQVLCQLWRLYLQRSHQAYTSNPVSAAIFKVGNSKSDTESIAESASETDGERSQDGANAESSWSQGSVDGVSYKASRAKRPGLMSMRKTLALIHLALIWSREPLTLSDLLRLVNEGHVPYVNAYEELPEEMMLNGRDAVIFKVDSIPSYQMVHKEAQSLGLFLQLQAFPPISRQTLLHPALLTVRYLMDVNLPDELHPWVCRTIECAGMADETLHTFNATSHPNLPQNDVTAAALIIVTVKLMFGMDDHTEWTLSNEASVQDDQGVMFNLRRWYRLMQATLIKAQQRRDHNIARKQWKAKKILHRNKKMKYILVKKRRTAEQVKICFEKLSSCPVSVPLRDPSSFRFCWGDEDGADGPSLHHQKLDKVVTFKNDALTPTNSTYWHPALKLCTSWNCQSHYSEMEPTLPRSFVWLLQLFSFLLDVKPALLYEEVLMVERRIFTTTKKDKTKTRTRTGTPQRQLKTKESTRKPNR
ncbi:TATA box-binding protein-associated factor RNA polymerase I subunit B [Echeneis naucrates]|uniref:TATA box-binding protein-associated factor RNA polymerase I subunit B n=1 Tax=Echeneis naucrates TaxID=173247 RepID=A0A665TUW7_ECHNA|nr:TATA box-binding protein-associated factor RNA polymerase I subunit B [Echeneis naucrates]